MAWDWSELVATQKPVVHDSGLDSRMGAKQLMQLHLPGVDAPPTDREGLHADDNRVRSGCSPVERPTASSTWPPLGRCALTPLVGESAATSANALLPRFLSATVELRLHARCCCELVLTASPVRSGRQGDVSGSRRRAWWPPTRPRRYWIPAETPLTPHHCVRVRLPFRVRLV